MMSWSPVIWRAKIEELVESCAERVFQELEQEISERLAQMSHDIVEELLLGETDQISLQNCIPPKTKLFNEGVDEIREDEIKEDESIVDLKDESIVDIKDESIVDMKGESIVDLTEESRETLWYGLGIVAMDAGQAVETSIPGMEDSLCRIIQSGDLGMLSCPVPEGLYNEEALSINLQNLDWVEACAFRHEQALLRIMESTTVIPLPFCTIFTDEEHIRQQLEHNYAKLKREVERLQGCYEMQVRLLVSPQLLHQYLTKADSGGTNQGGGNYLLRRQWEKKLELEKEQLLSDHGEALYQALKEVAQAAELQELGEADREDGLRVVFTAWFLLAGKGQNQWNEKIQAFDQETDAYGFVVEIAGPFPPYHFTGEEEASSGGDS